MRKTELANGEYYHIFNRGVDKRKIFLDESDFKRFWLSMRLLNDEKDGMMLNWRNQKRFKPELDMEIFIRQELSSCREALVKIIAYCLNPNHFHFILKQRKEDGIRKFMHKIGTSYTNFFNAKYDRSGALCQGRFKSIHIKNDSRLLYLVSYVNCNSEVHGISKALKYKWCSYPEYMGLCKDEICDKQIILEQFRGRKDYAEFARESVQDAKQKKEDEKSFLE